MSIKLGSLTPPNAVTIVSFALLGNFRKQIDIVL